MNVLLREAADNDMELVLSWRNNPLIWHYLYQQSKENRLLTWDEHYNWWKTRHTWKQFIIQVNDEKWTRDVGYINFGQLDSWTPQIGIVIGEVTLWGKGVGTKALTLGINWLKEQGYTNVWTTILKNNERSIRAFETVGFKRTGEGREGEWRYELRITPT